MFFYSTFLLSSSSTYYIFISFSWSSSSVVQSTFQLMITDTFACSDNRVTRKEKSLYFFSIYTYFFIIRDSNFWIGQLWNHHSFEFYRVRRDKCKKNTRTSIPKQANRLDGCKTLRDRANAHRNQAKLCESYFKCACEWVSDWMCKNENWDLQLKNPEYKIIHIFSEIKCKC